MKKTASDIPSIRWITSRNHWRMDARYKGARKIFYSSISNQKKAAIDIRQRYFAWIEECENPKPIIFKDGYAEYKLIHDELVTINTARTEHNKALKHLFPTLEHQAIVDITKQQLQAIINTAAKNGINKKGSMLCLISQIKNIWRFFAAEGIIPDYAVPQHFIMPRELQEKNEKKALTTSEIQRLFSIDAESIAPWYINHFRFMLLTGLRRGELLALQTERDFDGKYIAVRESRGDYETTSGKTKYANRIIRLSSLALEQIYMHHAMRQKQDRHSIALFSPDSYNDFCTPRILTYNWMQFAKKIGFDISLHELRHTFISYVHNKTDIGMDSLKKIVGHSKTMKTESTYVHELELTEAEKQILAKVDSEQASAINNVFSSLLLDENNVMDNVI